MSDYTPSQLDRGIINSIEHGNLSDLRFFIEDGGSVDAQTPDGMSALQFAIRENRADMAAYLLRQGANPNLVYPGSGNTALHYAARRGMLAVVDLLINYKADINAKNQYQQTPLHRAVAGGHIACVERLLAAGADVFAADYQNITPAMQAGRLAAEAKLNEKRPLADIAFMLRRKQDELTGEAQYRLAQKARLELVKKARGSGQDWKPKN